MQYKILTYVLIALLLCSQVSAQVVVDCEEMPSGDLHSMHDMQAMEHTDHSMMKDISQSDCCGGDCRCLQGAMTSVALLADNVSQHVKRENCGILHTPFFVLEPPLVVSVIPPISA